MARLTAKERDELAMKNIHEYINALNVPIERNDEDIDFVFEGIEFSVSPIKKIGKYKFGSINYEKFPICGWSEFKTFEDFKENFECILEDMRKRESEK